MTDNQKRESAFDRALQRASKVLQVGDAAADALAHMVNGVTVPGAVAVGLKVINGVRRHREQSHFGYFGNGWCSLDVWGYETTLFRSVALRAKPEKPPSRNSAASPSFAGAPKVPPAMQTSGSRSRTMTEMHAPIHVTDLELMLKRVSMIRRMTDAPREVQADAIRKIDLESFSAVDRINAAQETWKPHQVYVFQQFLMEKTKPPKGDD
jgi:hypothetical protein